MEHRISMLAIAVGVWWGFLFSNSAAQNLRDFTDQEPTTQGLIEGLKSKGDLPPASQMTGRTRSIGLVSSPVTEPRCEHYWQQASKKGLSRGIKLTEDMSSISLKVIFAVNSDQLTPDSKQTLDKLGAALKSNELNTCCFQIEGHTDSIGSDAYNLRLSKHRAESVRKYLAHNFDLGERTISVGYGKTKPIAENDTEEGKRKNRRVQVINLGHRQP